MSEESPLSALMAVMSPRDGADDRVDWAAAREEWGVSFPSDYIAFMAAYGSGGIDDAFSVLAPALAEDSPWNAEYDGMAAETRNLRFTWRRERPPEGVAADPDRLIAWGVSCGADILGWVTDDGDPDAWPVVVWERHGSPTWKVYDMGMAEFLRRVFRRGFPECPLSDLSLWGEPAPHFVHWRVERQRWESGFNPYTGKPDPYFGMTFD
ncbi:SMI1/KNR4 family protein [Streptomyces sp. NPDC014894]|uniref:SMI1/KNR4 family protein n=1 Tax=Streptomyces sp. NPDC014894 TaxID=3364931 RepID=UPI0036FC30A9